MGVGGRWIVLLFLVAVSAQATFPEQLHFSAEDDHVKRPVRLPPAAIQALSKEKSLRGSMEDAQVTLAPQSWFLASVVHLHTKDEADLLVEATGPLAGGNVSNFWILVPAVQGYTVILAGPAHDLLVRRGRSNGYRNIELDSMTASAIDVADVRFDGKAYKLYKDKIQKIKKPTAPRAIDKLEM